VIICKDSEHILGKITAFKKYHAEHAYRDLIRLAFSLRTTRNSNRQLEKMASVKTYMLGGTL
jgi:hypothetical protein